jgi:hypothetical protein
VDGERWDSTEFPAIIQPIAFDLSPDGNHLVVVGNGYKYLEGKDITEQSGVHVCLYGATSPDQQIHEWLMASPICICIDSSEPPPTVHDVAFIPNIDDPDKSKHIAVTLESRVQFLVWHIYETILEVSDLVSPTVTAAVDASFSSVDYILSPDGTEAHFLFGGTTEFGPLLVLYSDLSLENSLQAYYLERTSLQMADIGVHPIAGHFAAISSLPDGDAAFLGLVRHVLDDGSPAPPQRFIRSIPLQISRVKRLYWLPVEIAPSHSISFPAWPPGCSYL